MVPYKKKLFIFFTVFCFFFLFIRTEAGASPEQFKTSEVGATFEGGKPPWLGDPISAANGAYYFTMPLLSLGGLMDLRFKLIYRSDYLRFSDQFLPTTFWWRPYAEAELGVMIDTTEYGTVYLPNGDNVSFKKDASGNWTLTDPSVNLWGMTLVDNRPQIQYVLKKTTDFAYLMDPINERVYIFEECRTFSGSTRSYRIGRILDRNGNQLIYTHEAGGFDIDMKPWKINEVIKIEDGLGRFMNLTYGGLRSYLQTVTDQSGRQVRLIYDAGETDNGNGTTLRSVTDAMNQTAAFQYAGVLFGINNLISKQIRPRGNTPFTQTYGLQEIHDSHFVRVISQADADGNTRSLTYTTPNDSITVTRPDGTTEKYETYSSHGLLKSLTDPTNKKAEFTKDLDEHITSVKDRIGDTTSFTYHTETGKLDSITNAKGNTITYTYTAQDQIITNPILTTEQVAFTFYNLTRIDYPDLTNEQFTYDANGNMLTRIDRAGKTWTYTYNSKGQVLTITNPSGGVITYTYYNDGTLASSMDSGTGTTTYGYDTYKRLNRITHPDTTFIQMAYNLNDQTTSITDENNHTYTYEYDANGNLTGVTDPAGKETEYEYDDMDRVKKVTNKLDKEINLSYNTMGQLRTITDPNGLATNFSYDSRGSLNGVTLGGQTWQSGYDDEGIVSSAKTPLNNTTTLQSDKLGFITGMANPLNQTATFTRDTLSRITGITDPLNRTTTYTYDNLGLLSGVTVPVIGTATYQRNDLGLLSQITDLEGSHWTFGYTNAGRRQSSTDPLGNISQYSYDTLGRLSQTTYPDGGTHTRSYDGAGNLTRRLFSDSTDLQFTYDENDCLIGTNNLQLTLDPECRVTNTENPGVVFGATYDDAGRLKTATYPSTGSGQAFTVTYTYDTTTGLLSHVADNLTGTQIDFTYDNGRRLTGMNRPNGVNTTLTWDNASRLIRIQDGPSTGSGFIDLQYTLDAAGRVVGLNMTAPLDPADFLSVGTESFAYDAASRLITSGYIYDLRRRLVQSPDHTFTWDSASRLRRIGSTPITLTYNGLYEVTTRTEDEETIHYYYNKAIGCMAIVAEKDEGTGLFLRYYVWTPEGRLLYMIDAANGNKVHFYHFDLTGSTLALTGSTGEVTVAYAYDPYGQVLAHQGSSMQIFTYLGQWGVRWEGPSTDSGYGIFFQMGAQYYDAETGRFLCPVPRQLNPYQYAFNQPTKRFACPKKPPSIEEEEEDEEEEPPEPGEGPKPPEPPKKPKDPKKPGDGGILGRRQTVEKALQVITPSAFVQQRVSGIPGIQGPPTITPSAIADQIIYESPDNGPFEPPVAPPLKLMGIPTPWGILDRPGQLFKAPVAPPLKLMGIPTPWGILDRLGQLFKAPVAPPLKLMGIPTPWGILDRPGQLFKPPEAPPLKLMGIPTPWGSHEEDNKGVSP